MEITVVEQKVFLVEARLSPEQAKERAWDQKMAAFGSLSRLLLRPKGDEITPRPGSCTKQCGAAIAMVL